MECYACEQAATLHCSRCGKGYCPDHGDDPASGGQGLCAECLNPVSAAPSNVIFRSSLFALLIGSVLALWLLIRPPDLPGEGSSAVRPQPTLNTSPVATKASDLPTPTAAPGTTPTPVPETPAPQPTQYTVVEHDTWYGIAGAFGVDATALAAANGKTLEDFIHAGDVLVIPR